MVTNELSVHMGNAKHKEKFCFHIIKENLNVNMNCEGLGIRDESILEIGLKVIKGEIF